MTNTARIWCFTVLAGLASAGGAYAQAASTARSDLSSSRLDMTGEAPPACVLSPPVPVGMTNATLQAGTNRSAQVTVTELADPETAIPRAAMINLGFSVICNTAHDITVHTERGGLALLANGPVAAPGFRTLLPYRIDMSWAGVRSTGASNSNTSLNIHTNDGAAGTLSVAVDIPEGGDPLVAGPYSDSLIIDLLPAN